MRETAVKNAMTCRGWTCPEKLSLLYDLEKKTKYLDGDILEIGSAFGRSTVLLGFASKKTIWSIDPHTGGIKFIKRNENQNSFDVFIKNLEKFRLINRIKILKYTTQDVLDNKLIPEDIKFSFAFIDGLHTPDGVKTDMEFLDDRLLKSGIVAFDDYFGETFQDYSEAIDIIVKEKKIDLIKNEIAQIVYFIK